MAHETFQAAGVHFESPKEQELETIQRLESCMNCLYVCVTFHDGLDATSIRTTREKVSHKPTGFIFLGIMWSSKVCINGQL